MEQSNRLVELAGSTRSSMGYFWALTVAQSSRSPLKIISILVWRRGQNSLNSNDWEKCTTKLKIFPMQIYFVYVKRWRGERFPLPLESVAAHEVSWVAYRLFELALDDGCRDPLANDSWDRFTWDTRIVPVLSRDQVVECQSLIHRDPIITPR